MILSGEDGPADKQRMAWPVTNGRESKRRLMVTPFMPFLIET